MCTGDCVGDGSAADAAKQAGLDYFTEACRPQACRSLRAWLSSERLNELSILIV
jgi:hypothetical protein